MDKREKKEMDARRRTMFKWKGEMDNENQLPWPFGRPH